MRKSAILLTITAIVAAVSIGAYSAHANPSTISTVPLTGLQATTTGAFLTASGGATSTYPAYIERYDQVDLNLIVEGSTTASIINFQLEFSDDNNCVAVPTGCNWYREDVNSISGAVITHAVNPYHVWAPVSAATTTKNITISSLGARWMRVGFAAQGANARVWAQIAGKVQQP